MLMFNFFVPFAVGIFVGGIVGFSAACMMASASAADRKSENIKEK